MLLELNIKNFAIIDDIRISFDKGLNVITGETGSGKSIIIDALGMILGARASRDVIKKGAEKAYLEAIFTSESKQIESILEEMGIDSGEILTISKEINLNRPSISRINGQTVTLNNLNKITEIIIDVFAQHESQALMNIRNQKLLIDSFGDKEHLDNLKELFGLWQEHSSLLADFKEKSESITGKDREIDLIKYQIEEIEDANITERDGEELENEVIKATNASKILEDMNRVVGSIKSDYSDNGVLDMLDSNISILNAIENFDSEIGQYALDMENIRILLGELTTSLENYLERMDLDEEKLDYLVQRLDLINNIKRKYGYTVEEIEKYYNEINKRLLFLLNYEDNLKEMEKRLSQINLQMDKICNEISVCRKQVSLSLEKSIALELRDLNIANAKFKVDIKEKEISHDGKDGIEFMISTNIGEEVKPLSRTASGGEMSRIMLGFKSIIAKKDGIETLIFDEIDTGISGKTAQIVGNKIKEISKDRQVIVISHLPQIVALSNSHYLIEKDVVDNITYSTIRKLGFEERVEELARLIGGLDNTESIIKTAREIIEKNLQNN